MEKLPETSITKIVNFYRFRIRQLKIDFIGWHNIPEKILNKNSVYHKSIVSKILRISKLYNNLTTKTTLGIDNISDDILQEIDNSIIEAQVMLDNLLYRSIDPTIGWVIDNFSKQDKSRLQITDNITSMQEEAKILSIKYPNHLWSTFYSKSYDSFKTKVADLAHENIRFIDTQLMRLYLNTQYSEHLIRLEYKPKKASFLLASDLIGQMIANYPILKDIQDYSMRCNNVTYLVTRRTPGIVSIRFEKYFEDGGVRTKLFTEYTVRAGLGSFRPNSTTGLEINYWTESQSDTDPAQSTLILRFNARLISSTYVYALRLLKSVGAVSDEIYSADLHSFCAKEIGFDIFGIRLIDGVDGSLIDFRFSRPITTISTATYLSEKEESQASPIPYIQCEFIQIAFEIDASKIKSFYNALSLFISIN